MDHIIEQEQWLADLVELLAPFDVFFVGMPCPLLELERRERQRGDRRPGEARRDFHIVHRFTEYDLAIDEIQPTEGNVARLITAWQRGAAGRHLRAWRHTALGFRRQGTGAFSGGLNPLRTWAGPNTALEATGHSGCFLAGVGLSVARASAWAFGCPRSQGSEKRSDQSMQGSTLRRRRAPCGGARSGCSFSLPVVSWPRRRC